MLKKHIFISYVREDEAEVARLVGDLEARGESVWWDQMILPGQNWKHQVQLAIRESFAAIVCLSPASVARVRSGQFSELAALSEIVAGYSQLAPYLFPVRLQECEIPYYSFTAQVTLDQLECTDLYPEGQRETNLDRLVEGLARAPERPIAARPELTSAPRGSRLNWPASGAEARGPFWGRLLAVHAPRLHGRLVRSQFLSKAPDYEALRQYLVWFENRMLKLNGQVPGRSRDSAELPGENVFITPRGLAPEDTRTALALPSSDYAPVTGNEQTIQQVRQQIRMVRELMRGAEDVTAPIAAMSPNSRLVRDVMRVLDRARQPLVLLGEPGGGKSTVLREIAIRYAQRGLTYGEPPLPVYVVLGAYRSVGPDRQPAEVLSLVEKSIPREYAILRARVPALLEQGRLVVFFDGMDEMDRDLYTERNRKLSDFAFRYQLQLKTLFACRTANFSPAFDHRQVYLLPFSPAQIREYVRKNFPRETRIDNRVYTQKQIAQRLLSSASFRGTAQLPLTLFLLRYYVLVQKHSWPESRHQLYGTYIEFLYGRLWHYWDSAEMLDQAVPVEDVVRGWEALAYEVMVAKEGTCLSRAELERIAGALRQPQLVSWAERSGLLRPEFSDEDENGETKGVTTRFSHHQIQEYLAAKHLVTHEGEDSLDWTSLLDSPRWQETLVHAASINPGSLPALAVIESTFADIEAAYGQLEQEKAANEAATKDLEKQFSAIQPDYHMSVGEGGSVPVYGPEKTAQREMLTKSIEAKKRERKTLDFKVPSGRERVWADRVVFTSLLFKEAGNARGSLRDPIPGLYANAVKHLAKQGRPPSQVKMLWAFRNAPDACARADLAVPFRSPIAWVRDQAIAVIGNLAGRTDAEVDGELLFDMSRGRLLSRVPAYWRASSGRIDWALTVAWAVVCDVLLYAGLVAIAFGAILAAMTLTKWQAPPAYSLPALHRLGAPWDSSVPLFVAAALLTLCSSVVRTWPFTRRIPIAAGAIAGIAVGWNGIARFHSSEVAGLAAGIGLCVLTGVATWLWTRCWWWTFAVPARWLRGKRNVRAFLRTALQFHDSTPDLIPMILGAAVVGLALIFGFFSGLGDLFDWLGKWHWLAVAGGVLVGLLGGGMCVFGVVATLWAAFESYKELVQKRTKLRSVRAILGRDLALLMTVLVLAAAAYRVGWVIPIGKALGVVLAGAGFIWAGVVGVALLIFLGYFSLKGIKWWTHSAFSMLRFRFMGPFFRWFSTLPDDLDAAGWRELFQTGNEFDQAIMLSQTSENSLRASRSAFLTFLESCEIDVKGEPASGIYWRKRHELEEILKHEHSALGGQGA